MSSNQVVSHQYPDCPVYVRDYLMYLLTIKNRSPRTVDEYYLDLRKYLRYIACQRAGVTTPEALSETDVSKLDFSVVAGVSLSDVYAYLNYVYTVDGNNSRSRARKISCLRSFYKYLSTKTALLQDNPLKNLDLPSPRRALPRYLSLEQSLQMLETAGEQAQARDYCMLTLFLNCGMRLSELCGINMSDIQLPSIRITGKGGKERLVYLNDACTAALQAYLPERTQPRPGVGDPLFVSAQSRRISGRRVEQIIAAQLTRAGLDGQGFSVHKLRHTAATLMHRYGKVDIRVLQEVLGHQNLATTQIYTHVSLDQLESAVTSSPLAHVPAPQAAEAVQGADETADKLDKSDKNSDK